VVVGGFVRRGMHGTIIIENYLYTFYLTYGMIDYLDRGLRKIRNNLSHKKDSAVDIGDPNLPRIAIRIDEIRKKNLLRGHHF